MTFSFRPMTPSELDVVNRWEWDDVVFSRPALPTEIDTYTTHDHAGAVVGYCSFGDPPELDRKLFVGVSVGLRPDLVGGGNGTAFMAAILDHARVVFPDHVVAGVIKHSNPRSLEAARSAGFEVLGETADAEGVMVVDVARLASMRSP